MNYTSKIFNVLKYILLIAILVIMVFPLIYAFFASFKTNLEIMTDSGKLLPNKFTLDNYRTIFDPANNFNFSRMTLNSLYLTVVSIIISLGLSTTIAYVYVRGVFKGKKIVFACLMSIMFITTGGLTVYPTFNIYKVMHIPIGLNALIFRGLFNIPVAHFLLVSGYVKAIPLEMDEAAEIDGCGFIERYWRIILPNLKTILATLTILAFNGNWNSYLVPAMYTASVPEQQTLMVGLMSLKNSTESASNWGLLLAGSMIAILPVMIVFLFFNRYITESIVGSSVKG